MIITMTSLEKAAIDYASQFKDWDKQIIAKDAYLAGAKHSSPLSIVQVEFMDGSHQLIDEIKK